MSLHETVLAVRVLYGGRLRNDSTDHCNKQGGSKTWKQNENPYNFYQDFHLLQDFLYQDFRINIRKLVSHFILKMLDIFYTIGFFWYKITDFVNWPILGWPFLSMTCTIFFPQIIFRNLYLVQNDRHLSHCFGT